MEGPRAPASRRSGTRCFVFMPLFLFLVAVSFYGRADAANTQGGPNNANYTSTLNIIATTQNWGVGFPENSANSSIYLLDASLQPFVNQFYISFGQLRESNGVTVEWSSTGASSNLSTSKQDIGTKHYVTFVFNYTAKGIVQIEYIAFEGNDTVTPYPGTTIYIPPLSVKFTIKIFNWNFTTAGNTFDLDLYLTPVSKQAPLTNGQGVYGVIDNLMDIQASFINECGINNVATPLTSLQSSVVSPNILVTISFPAFTSADTLIYDPDFAVLLQTDTGAGGGDGDGFIDSSGGLALVIVVPVVVFLIIVLAVFAFVGLAVYLTLRKQWMRQDVETRAREATLSMQRDKTEEL